MVLMFSTLATLVLLSFLLFVGLVLLFWSLISFGSGPRAVNMPWGKSGAKRSEALNPFVKKDGASSEVAPDHISRGQIRTVKKPVSDVTLAEIKAITKEKVETPEKTTTYEQMVKRAKNPTLAPSRASTPVPPSKDLKTNHQLTKNQVNNDQLRGAHAKKTLVDQMIEIPGQDLSSSNASSAPQPGNSQSEKPKEVPPFVQVEELKNLPPSPIRPNVTYSSNDTPVAKLPAKSLPEKPAIIVQPASEKKLWPAPLAPMVPKPAVPQDPAIALIPQPFKADTENVLKPEAVPKAQSREINKKSSDPFEKFSKDKKDDTLF